jgi:hypothetical protein
MTDVPLSSNAKNALTKGLAFTPTPRNPPAADLIVTAEEAAALLGGDTEAAMHIRSNTFNAIKNYQAPQPNLTRGEQKAIQKLKKDCNVTIFPAKGPRRSSYR